LLLNADYLWGVEMPPANLIIGEKMKKLIGKILCDLGKHKPYITTEDGHFLMKRDDLKFKLFLMKAGITYTVHCLRCRKFLII